MREAFRRPLLVVVVATYLLYGVAGQALKDRIARSSSMKSALLRMALRAWPHPAVQAS